MNIIRFLKKVFIISLTPFYLLIFLLRPFILIRFGKINSSRIGHFVINTALNYLDQKTKNKKLKTLVKIDFYYTDKIISNYFVLILWKRNIIILPRILIFPFYSFFKYFIRDSKHLCDDFKNHDRDINKLIAINKIIFKLKNKELYHGNYILQNMGIQSNKFVVIYNRDSLFLKKNFKADFSHHDFRNSKIENYLLAAEELTKNNFYGVRAGKNVETELKTQNNKIINYADSKYQSDFMDVFIHFKCEFVISNGQGIDSLARMFKKPLLTVNYAPYAFISTFWSNNMYIFKKYYNNSSKRFISLSEIFNIGAANILDGSNFAKKNISLIENTPIEIKEAVLEMLEYLYSNKKKLELNEYENKFWNIYYQNIDKYNFRHLHPQNNDKSAKICKKFLYENKYLLK